MNYLVVSAIATFMIYTLIKSAARGNTKLAEKAFLAYCIILSVVLVSLYILAK